MKDKKDPISTSICVHCGGWYLAGGGFLSPQGASNIGMNYRMQCGSGGRAPTDGKPVKWVGPPKS